MNISFNANNQYYSPYMKSAQGSLFAQNQVGNQGGAAKNTVMGKKAVNPVASSFDRITDKASEDRNGLSQQMRQMIRTLKQDSLQNQNNKKVRGFWHDGGYYASPLMYICN